VGAGIAAAVAAAAAVLAPTPVTADRHPGPEGPLPHVALPPTTAAHTPSPSHPVTVGGGSGLGPRGLPRAPARPDVPVPGRTAPAAPVPAGHVPDGNPVPLATGPVGDAMLPVLPLGAGLTCLGLGIGIIGYRLRQG
jgi:hypothetical protein